jgi:hypothetical protein
MLSVLDRARLTGQCITVWPTAGTVHSEGTTRNDGLVISVVSKLCDVYPVAWIMTCWLRLALMAVAVDRRIDVSRLTHFPKGLCGVLLPFVVISLSFGLVLRSDQRRTYLEHMCHTYVAKSSSAACVHECVFSSCCDTSDMRVAVVIVLCPRTGAVVDCV